MSEHVEADSGQPESFSNRSEAESAKPLALVRNRHGRPVRRFAQSPLVAQSLSRPGNFEEIVKNTVDFISANYADELGELRYEVYDSPSYRPGSKKVRRWAVKTDQMAIVIYRLPIERFGQHRRKTNFEVRMSIEFQVFSAAAELIGREPDFFLGDH
jgi:hypothetical protein